MTTYESETWMIAVGGLFVGVVGLCCKYFYKIKITDCGVCWGFISVKRDIPDELEAAAAGCDIENPSAEDVPMQTFSATRRLSLPPGTRRPSLPLYSLTHPDLCGVDNIPL